MQVDDALIDKLSRLSMLQFNDEERAEIKTDLQKMISFVDKLKEIDTTGVAPLLHLNSPDMALREDVCGNILTQKEALENAPHTDGVYFKVPKVIKKPE